MRQSKVETMITARDAAIEANRLKEIDESMNEIDALIKAAIIKREYSIYYKKGLSDEAIRRLRQLGYSVSCSCYGNNTISWSKYL